MSDITDEQMDSLMEDLEAIHEKHGSPAEKTYEYLADEADAWERHGHPGFARLLRGHIPEVMS